MTSSNVHPAAAKRDAAHRRVRRVTLGVAAVAVGVTSYGAVSLAQVAADSGSVTTATQQGNTGNTGGNVTSGTHHTPVATSGGS
jgi:hypothetical protein